MGFVCGGNVISRPHTNILHALPPISEQAEERELGDGLKLRLSMSTSTMLRTNDSLRALSMGSMVTHRKGAAAPPAEPELELPPKKQ